MPLGWFRRGLKILVSAAVVATLASVSVSASAGPAEAARKSPKMYAVSAFPTIYKEDGTLAQPTEPRNHWYLDIWDSSNKLTVRLNKNAKGKVCVYLSELGSSYVKVLCKKVKKGRVIFESNPDASYFDRYDESDSPLCDLDPGSFGCDAALDLMVNDYFTVKAKMVFSPSNKKFKKQTLRIPVTLFDHLTLIGDYRR
jgi:hypothetical protein